ncbi:MAG: tetratricopeptide repeat protein [Anaerolineae bacterium]|nr:tetratricopeptide repeat protein [Anaerolineae bacterium]
MGQKLLAQLLPALEKMKFSGNNALTPVGYTVFEVGRDRIDGYRGDPRTLGDALRMFQTADSLPYEYTGIALALLAAAREDDGSYAPQGLDAALTWLEQAQELVPDNVDINVVESFIYIYGQRLDDARLVLDYLQQQDDEHYYLHRAEIDYWRARGDLDQALSWSEKATSIAETVPQRLRVRSIMADLHAERGDREAALHSYRQAVHFDPDNAWLWYRVAQLYAEGGDWEEARKANEHALALDATLAEAQALQQSLDEREDRGNFLGRLFSN